MYFDQLFLTSPVIANKHPGSDRRLHGDRNTSEYEYNMFDQV